MQSAKAIKETRARLREHKSKTQIPLFFSVGAVRNQHPMVPDSAWSRRGWKLLILLLISCWLSLHGTSKAMADDNSADQPKDAPLLSSQAALTASPAPDSIHQVFYAAAPVLTGAFFMPLHPSLLSGGWLNRIMARMPAGFQKWSAGVVAALSGAYFINLATREPFQSMSLEELWSGVLLSASQLQGHPTDGDNSYRRSYQNQQNPTPEDPNPMIPPSLGIARESDMEAISDKAFDRYSQKDSDANELWVMKQILSRFVNSHRFLNSPGAEKLMLLPSTLSKDHLHERLSLLTDAKGKPLLTPKALASWDRRQLYNFLASEIQSALEVHIFLGGILANEWKTVELSNIYEEEPGTILAAKYRLFERIAQYDKAHHKARVKLGKNASMAQVHKALIGLSPSYIKSTIETKMIALGKPPLSVGQKPFLQGKHLYSYYLYLSNVKGLNQKLQKDHGDKKKIFLQEILEVQESEFLDKNPKDGHLVRYSDRIKYPTQEAFRKQVINTYTDMIEFFIRQDIFMPPELIAYNGSMGERAEEILGTLHSTLLTYNAAKFQKIGKKLGLKASLTQDKVERFLDIISPFSLAQVLLLSQVFGIDTVDKKELYVTFDLSPPEFKNYSERMETVFINFISPAGSHKTLAAQLATRKLKKTTKQPRIFSVSQLAEKFASFTDRKLLRSLLSNYEDTYTIKAGVDLSVDRLAFHEMIKAITADPVKQRIFYSQYLHLDEADQKIIAEIFQLSEKTINQKTLEIHNEVLAFLGKHAESRDGGFQILSLDHQVTTASVKKQDRDKKNEENYDPTFLKDKKTHQNISHQIFYQRFSQLAIQPYSEEVVDTMLHKLHPQNNPDWASYQEQLGTRQWLMKSVGQPVLISKKQYVTFVTEVLDTPLKKHIFLSKLVELPELSWSKLMAIHGMGRFNLEKVELSIKRNFLQVILGGELVDIASLSGTPAFLRQQLKLYTDSLTFNLLSSEDLVGNMEKAMGQRYGIEPKTVQDVADLIKQKQQDWVLTDEERAIYLYLFHGFQPGHIAVASSYAGRGSVPHSQEVMKLWSLTPPKVSIYLANLKHMVNRTLEDLSLEENTEVVVSVADPRPFIEWYEDRKILEIKERLAHWYKYATRRRLDMQEGALVSLQSFIHSELATSEDWYNYLVGILSYPVVGELQEAVDAAGASSYHMSRDKADQIRGLESKLLGYIGTDRDLARHSAPSVGSDSVVLRQPTSLLRFPLHFFEAKLRRILMKPDYSLSTPKLRFFEKHYLSTSPMLWQIYLQLAGYQTEFAGKLHPHELHPAVLKDLQRKMLVALSLATTSSSRLYISDMISVFSALKAPNQAINATLDLKDLKNFYSVYSMEAVVEHLKALPWLPSSQDIRKSYLAHEPHPVTSEEALLREDLSEYLASDVFVDPFLHHIFLSHIMALDEFSVSKMSTTYGYSKREITDAIRKLTDEITAIIDEHIDRSLESSEK